MLSAIISSSVKFRVLVLLGAVALILFGMRATVHIPLDVFPEFAPVIVEIQTEAPGLSTEEVDDLVTMPLGLALNGTPQMVTIRSKSVLGLSSITILFERGTDLLKARQLVAERLDLAKSRLPAVAKAPVLMAPFSSLSRCLKIGLSSKTLDIQELSEIALWKVKPLLTAQDGVANIQVWGQRDKQYQVLIDSERLAALGVSVDKVVRAAGAAVDIASGGLLDTENQRIAIRQVSTIATPDDIGECIVEFQNGVPVKIKDVATVVFGNPPLIGDAVINGGYGILLIVEKQPWGNTLDVTKRCERVIDHLRPSLPGVDIDTTIFRPATFIEMSIRNLMNALVLGCLMVALVLAAFLFNWRTMLISLVAIPLSLLTGVVALYLQGATLNTMTLAGLIIAIGEVIDDAIISVENIYRRMRLNAQNGKPLSAYQVVLEASIEVRSAIIYATFIVILVFVPVFFLDGVAGTFFRPLATAYVLAIVASLLVSLTVVPAMSYLLLRNVSDKERETRLGIWMGRCYVRILPFCVRHFILLSLALFGILGGSVYLYSRMGQEFLPNFKERDFLMHWLEKPTTGLDAMRRITFAAGEDLMAVEGVRNFGAHLGRAEVADEVVGPDFTELWISIDEKADYDTTLKKVEQVILSYPGLFKDVLTFLRERIKEVLSGASAAIVVRIYGEDLEVLRNTANALKKKIEDVEGVSGLKVESLNLVPQLVIRMDNKTLAANALNAKDVRQTAALYLKGQKVGQVFEDQRIHDVMVWGEPHTRDSIHAIAQLLVENQRGDYLRLGDVATLEIIPSPNAIKRENNSRRIDITCNVQGRDLSFVAQDVEARLKATQLPPQYHSEILGEYVAQKAAARRLLVLSLMVFLGVLALLQSDFRSWTQAVIIMINIPFCLIGSVLAIYLGSGVVSLGAFVGFVTVLGVAVRNGIMLMSHYRHLRLKEGLGFGMELVLRGARERLTPILMTALTSVLALLPLIYFGNLPGYEIEYPLALVAVGGLMSSMLLNLFFVPALYYKLCQKNTPECEE